MNDNTHWIDFGQQLSELRNKNNELIATLVLFNPENEIWFFRYNEKTIDFKASNMSDAKKKAVMRLNYKANVG